MSQQNVKISLNIVHPSRDLSKVCEQLGFQPKVLWTKGHERRTPRGNRISGCHENSRCLIEFGPPSDSSLSDQLSLIAQKLGPNRKLLRRLSFSGATLNFFIGIFIDKNNVETLNFDLIEAIADLRIGLVFDIYPPDQTEEHHDIMSGA